MKLSPEGCRVLVRPDKVEEMTSGEHGKSIIRPQQTQEDDQYAVTIGEVIAIGPGVESFFNPTEKDKKGALQVGDRVHYSKYSGRNIEWENDIYRVINDEDIHLREEDVGL